MSDNAPKKSPFSVFDLSEADATHIKHLIQLMTETDLAELELEHDDTRLRLRRQGAAPVAQAPNMVTVEVPSQPAATAPAPAPAAAPAAKTLKAPLVGTFYHAASPDSDPFVKVGDPVKKGQVIGIIEAMKTMNQIEAEQDGTVAELLAADASPVEYNQPLIRLA